MTQPPTRLWNRNFFLLWQGQLVSNLGTQACSIAMMFWIKHAFGSASLMGGLMMVSLLPSALLAPMGGTVADQYSRRRIIIMADAVAGLIVLVLAGMMLMAPDQPRVILIVMLAGAVLMGVLQAFFGPAVGAAIPDLVPAGKLKAANSFYQSSSQLAVLVGQAVGGLLFVTLGAPLLLLINGITYWFSALSETFMVIPQQLPAERHWRQKVAEIGSDLVVGLRFMWTRPGLRAAILSASILNFFVAPVLVLLPFFVEDELGVTPDWYGYLLAGLGVGTIIGFALAGILKIGGRTKLTALIMAAVLKAVTIAAAALVTSASAALALMITVGVLTGFFNVHLISIVQVTTPSEIRGRVFGVVGALTSGLLPVGMGLGGVVADLLDQNISLVYGACGTVMAVLSLAIALSPAYRVFLATPMSADQENEAPGP